MYQFQVGKPTTPQSFEESYPWNPLNDAIELYLPVIRIAASAVMMRPDAVDALHVYMSTSDS